MRPYLQYIWLVIGILLNMPGKIVVANLIMEDPEIRKIKELLQLDPLPGEGGFFRRSYTSETRAGYQPMASAIYYLITPDSWSTLHRLPKDELYHFYAGNPVQMMLLSPQGHLEERVLGNIILTGQSPQILVPARTWQAARLKPGGRYALLGTTMSPAFVEEDLEIAEIEELIEEYPDYRNTIKKYWHE